jgi:hypothetical protein
MVFDHQTVANKKSQMAGAHSKVEPLLIKKALTCLTALTYEELALK